jgi:citrate lyase subunit beta/citryl-CoA lyase
MIDPRHILLGAQAGSVRIPVCDHYSGVEVRMKKSLALQAQMTEEFGACVFDVTLDCEDGAPVGGEVDHAHLVAELALGAAPSARVAVRVHSFDEAAFETDVNIIVKKAGSRLSHIMLPKIECAADIDKACAVIDRAQASSGRTDFIPIHALVESSHAIHKVFEIAAHPRLQSIGFGVMDFVSSHGGAIPASAMSANLEGSPSGLGQFLHPLVIRAKLEIAAACHAFGKTPSHCVFTEFKDVEALSNAARKASQELGYTRMWSIHPDQIRPILKAFAPTESEIETAANLLEAAAKVDWAPISFAGALHDRASYRYFWQVIERAHATGRVIPSNMSVYFT